MAIDFSAILTTEQKIEVLQQRISQFAAEGYQHTLNRQINISRDPEADVSQIDEAIDIISRAIETYKAELDTLVK